MNYIDGRKARLGDIVTLGSETARGVVVFSIDTDEFSPAFPKNDWAYLGRGVMIEFDRYGLIHYERAEDDLVLVSRASADGLPQGDA